MTTATIETLVVTRHKGLLDYLVAEGHIGGLVRVVAHATPADVAGKDVIGILPLSLAALAASVTEIPMTIPAELRGVELSEAQVRQYAGPPVTYRVSVITAE